jgi:hypothetical protein
LVLPSDWLFFNSNRFTKDRQKPLEEWELEAIKKINEKTSKMAHPYAAKYFGGK